MINNSWHDHFIETLYKKYPRKSQLTEALMDLLSIERESVYRRLRKDVMFSVDELMKIASAWNISIDEINKINTKKIFFKAQLSDFLDPSEKNLNNMRNRFHLNNVNSFSNMEYMEISNKLPCVLASGFSYLSKFQLLKSIYQYTDSEKTLPFSQISYPEKIFELLVEHHTTAKNVANTSFIWDPMLFKYLVGDIHYFYSIYLINDEEKKLIKKDLYDFLDYMSEVAIKGCWLETSKKVNLYISHINIDTNYSYYYSNEYKIARIHVFAKNEIYTDDTTMVENFRIWMKLKKRSSVQISKTDEKRRIEYFIKQRELINTL